MEENDIYYLYPTSHMINRISAELLGVAFVPLLGQLPVHIDLVIALSICWSYR